MLKWKLMLTTLPYVATALAVKLGIERGLGFEGFLEFSEVGLVLTGGVFLIGFMLAGTMADYKESEKIPAELACTLETLEETFVQASIAKPAVDAKAGRTQVLNVGQSIHDWLFGKLTQERLFERLGELGTSIHELEKAGAGGYASRALGELHNMRKTLTRVAVISRTGFLASGYALLETLTVTIIILVIIAKFKNPIAEMILTAFVSLIYVYMIRLIRDIDDPFEYSADGQKGAAEVDLFPLEEYIARSRAK